MDHYSNAAQAMQQSVGNPNGSQSGRLVAKADGLTENLNDALTQLRNASEMLGVIVGKLEGNHPRPVNAGTTPGAIPTIVSIANQIGAEAIDLTQELNRLNARL